MIRIYQFLYFFILQSIAVYCFFFKRKRLQDLKERKNSYKKLQHIQELKTDAIRILFYCSSAGEYEQSLPLIHQLISNYNYKVIIIFFSWSGYRFAEKRNEKIPFIISPPDQVFYWNKIYKQIWPSLVFVNRHEIWPSFLHFFKIKKGLPVFLINASLSNGSFSHFKKILYRNLYNKFDKIYCVSPQSKKILREVFLINENRLQVTGDSKFDRVKERSELANTNVIKINKLFPSSIKMILGSAWKQDWNIALDFFEDFLKNPLHPPQLQLVIAPHEPFAKESEDLLRQCYERNLTYEFYKNLPHSLSEKTNEEAPQVLIINELGILGELYKQCHLAYVGGANHNKVHNVLEPAIYGLPTAFGPFYENSEEAVGLMQEKLATVITNKQEMQNWVSTQFKENFKSGDTIKKWAENKCGASIRIVEDLATLKFIPLHAP